MSSEEVPIVREDADNPDQSEEDEILEIPGIGGSWLCHPQKLPHKAIALFLMCFLGFGSYYCYDNPGALQNHIVSDIPMTTFEFASLYSWYSWPNVILPIVGGYLIDAVFGIRIATVIFASFICLGQFIFATGGLNDSTTLMQAGRFVFGIGGESLAVAQNTYAAFWFSGNTLNMVFGFQLSIARFGSSVNYWTIGQIYEALSSHFEKPFTTLGWTLMIASFSCIFSLIASVILGFIDKRAQKILRKNESQQDKISLKDVLSFKTNFWLLSLVCVSYYVSVFPFVSLGQVFFIKKYGLGDHEANVITGLIYLISAFASPVLGFIIDRVGRNLTFVLFSVIFTLFSHMLLAFTDLNPYFPIVTMGFSYSLLASALWPICTLIIPENQLGTAFGLMQAFQNLGLALVPLGAGIIVDKFGYLWLEIFFMFWLSIATVSTLVMWLVDLYFNDSYLNMSAAARVEYKNDAARTRNESSVPEPSDY